MQKYIFPGDIYRATKTQQAEEVEVCTKPNTRIMVDRTNIAATTGTIASTTKHYGK